MLEIYTIYKKLLENYGPQGWWPLVSYKGTNPTKTGSVHGYHVGDYAFPQNDNQKFEICLGAILTQNTSWPQVERSLQNLQKINCLDPDKIETLSDEDLKDAIRSSGYHNQKARYIKNFISFFKKLERRTPTRNELLDLVGIGPETADSMLLYAFSLPEFVVDAYTKRIFLAIGLITEKYKYDDIKKIVEDEFKKKSKNNDELVVSYQEFHALLVEHAKRYYSKKPFVFDRVLIK